MPPSLEEQPTSDLLVSYKSDVRLDKYLAQRYPRLSRSYLQKLISQGNVAVNDSQVKASQQVQRGDRIRVELPPVPSLDLEPESIPLNIAYEDDEVLVIDKPAGISVHPGAGGQGGTLANALLAQYPSLEKVGESGRPGIVHRLDKNTSGLMIVAKSEGALKSLARQFKSRDVVKRYSALVKSKVKPDEGLINAPLGRNPKNRKRMALVAGGREAVTSYKVKRHLNDYTLLEVTPKTGRTHQIRVHMASVGHPIVGDAVYGSKHPGLDRHFLHASYLKFRLPKDSKHIELESRLPSDLQMVLDNLALDQQFWYKPT